MDERREIVRRHDDAGHLTDLSRELAESQSRLRQIVEKSPDAYLVIDRGGTIRFVNPAAIHLFGVPESRLVGSPFGFPLIEGENTEIDIINPRTGNLVAEMRVVETDWVGERAHVAALRDITERKRSELALQESERRLVLALKAGGSAPWEMDVETEIFLPVADKLLFTMLGYQPGELVSSREWLALIHEEDRPGVREIIDQVITGEKEGFWLELRLRAKDGSWRWILSQGVAGDRDARGKAIRIVGTHTDITQRKRAEEENRRLNAELEHRVAERTAELERSRQELQHSNDELERFAQAAAHDLQAPLRSILSFAQLLRAKWSGNGDEETHQWLGYIIDATRRLQTLIGDLLAYTRLDAQVHSFKAVDMGQQFDQVVAALAELIGSRRAEVVRGGLPVVRANPALMSQLLQNLIENGIKYNNSQSPRVTVKADRSGREWLFSVTDNGMGIAPEHHQRIFETLRRLHSYSEIPGSGIGLATCARIVQRHGGRIWVDSEKGKGSVFHFTLPAEGV